MSQLNEKKAAIILKFATVRARARAERPRYTLYRHRNQTHAACYVLRRSTHKKINVTNQYRLIVTCEARFVFVRVITLNDAKTNRAGGD